MKKLVTLVAFVLLVIGASLIFSTAEAKKQAPAPQQVVVQPGDTLWGIASDNRGSTEIRKYIYQMQQLNDIGSTIFPGQTLTLPPGS